MLVLIVWAVAVGLSLLILGILAYGLFGQLGRLRRAVAEAQADVLPAVRALSREVPEGRHRAD